MTIKMLEFVAVSLPARSHWCNFEFYIFITEHLKMIKATSKLKLDLKWTLSFQQDNDSNACFKIVK